MRKKALLVALIALLITAAAGTFFVRLSTANPYLRDYVAPDAYTKPPKISVYSPENNALCRNVNLSINVSLPQSTTAPFTFLHVVSYDADWLQNRTYLFVSMGLSDEIRSDNPPENQFFAYSGTLTGVPDGNHSLTLYAEGGGWYPPQGIKQSGFFIDGTLTVSFAVYNTPPTIALLSLENKTYYEFDVPLNFTTNETVSKISYSLDGQENVTIDGNATLSGLAEGQHDLTVYASDNIGNFGASESVYFTIAKSEFFPNVPVSAGVVSIALVAAGLLVYHKKHKRILIAV
jgi:hypothetical protein